MFCLKLNKYELFEVVDRCSETQPQVVEHLNELLVTEQEKGL